MGSDYDTVDTGELYKLYVSQNRAPTPESFGKRTGSDCLDILELFFCDCNCAWCTWGIIAIAICSLVSSH